MSKKVLVAIAVKIHDFGNDEKQGLRKIDRVCFAVIWGVFEAIYN